MHYFGKLQASFLYFFSSRALTTLGCDQEHAVHLHYGVPDRYSGCPPCSGTLKQGLH